MLRLLAVLGLLVGCGNDIDVRFVTPEPKHLEVGESASFVLDPSQSSSVIKSGTMVMTIDAITEEETVVRGVAHVQTIIGPKEFTMVNGIENELLTLEFLEKLRDEKTHQAKNALMTYSGLTREGCDIVALSNIKGSDNLTLIPTLCVSSRTMPQVAIKFNAGGTEIDAVFKAGK
jgi:hypothetical protein